MNNNLTIKENHNLSNRNIKHRIEEYIGVVKSKYGDIVDNIELSWDGYMGDLRLNIIGMKLRGKIELEKDLVIITSELPSPANLYTQELESILKNELKALLS